ncbi:MAG: wax ester/triacylglycerol synthase domain-containing protein [Actinomycetota bacterium]
MAASKKRDVDTSTRMTEHEALMWNVEKDPWLNPNGASLTVLDQPVDVERFRNQIRYGVTRMPRLYQRVVPGFGRLTPPTWAPDPEFDFDYHVREVSLPGPGSMRQLLDLAAQLYQEPLDRTRPLWRFVAISGVEGGRGAVYALTHHVIADGIGQLRMAELYQSISRDDPGPGPIDLDAFLAEVLAETAEPSDSDAVGQLVDAGRETAGHLFRRQAGIGRRLLGELMLWPADSDRMVEKLTDMGSTVASTAGLLTQDRSSDDDPSGSPLWRNRSRHRHLEHVQISLADLKAASKALGGSINDGFMVGLIEAAVRYHTERGVDVPAYNTSFVVSTRTDDAMGGNSFTPVPVQVDGSKVDFATRMADLQTVADEAREQSRRTGGISGLSGVINLLPTSVVTQTARRQAAGMDFATSNLRGAGFPLYCAGAHVEATVCMGPLAGTAVNATALSYDGRFDIGLFIDPVAIEDPDGYRRCVEESFADLLASAPTAAPGTTAPAPVTNGSAPVNGTTPMNGSTAANGSSPVSSEVVSAPVAEEAPDPTVVAETSTTRKASTAKASSKTSAAKKPAARKASSAKKPATKTSAARKTATKASSAKASSAKKPAATKAKRATAKASSAKKPAATKAKRATAKASSAKKPAAEKATTSKASAEKAATTSKAAASTAGDR